MTDAERVTLAACLRGRRGVQLHSETTAERACVTPAPGYLAIVYFTIPVTLYGIGFFLPQMLSAPPARATSSSAC